MRCPSFALMSFLPLGCLMPNPPAQATSAPAADATSDASTRAIGLHINSMTPTNDKASAENDGEAARYIQHRPCQSVTRRKDVEPQLDAGDVYSRLPPAVIQQLVRDKYALFRACYNDSLRRDPHLKGEISIRCVIEGDGTGSHVRKEGAS